MYKKSDWGFRMDGWIAYLTIFLMNFFLTACPSPWPSSWKYLCWKQIQSYLLFWTHYRHIRNNLQFLISKTASLISQVVKTFSLFFTTEKKILGFLPVIFGGRLVVGLAVRNILCAGRALTNCAKDLRNRISHLFTHLPPSSSLSIIGITIITRLCSSSSKWQSWAGAQVLIRNDICQIFYSSIFSNKHFLYFDITIFQNDNFVSRSFFL